MIEGFATDFGLNASAARAPTVRANRIERTVKGEHRGVIEPRLEVMLEQGKQATCGIVLDGRYIEDH